MDFERPGFVLTGLAANAVKSKSSSWESSKNFESDSLTSAAFPFSLARGLMYDLRLPLLDKPVPVMIGR
jgi:hypothetical protein